MTRVLMLTLVALFLQLGRGGLLHVEKRFDGFDMSLYFTVEGVTDEEFCEILLNANEVFLLLAGDNHLMLSPGRGQTYKFSSSVDPLIRVGENEPYQLEVDSSIDCLYLRNAQEVEAVTKALLEGQQVKLQFTTTELERKEVILCNPNLAYVYSKAVALCGWPHYRIPGVLATDAHLSVDRGQDGCASVTVFGNSALGLAKECDALGGGCRIKLGGRRWGGLHEVFGYEFGEWTCRGSDPIDPLTDEPLWGSTIVVRNAEGEIVFSERVPSAHDSAQADSRNPWPAAELAARAAWDAAPLGTVELRKERPIPSVESAPLYGFRELWLWGVDDGCLPSIE